MNQKTAYQLSLDFLAKKQENFTISEFKKLGKIIAFHSELYYEHEKPIISDSEYDILFKKLEFLETHFKSDINLTHMV